MLPFLIFANIEPSMQLCGTRQYLVCEVLHSDYILHVLSFGRTQRLGAAEAVATLFYLDLYI